MVIASLVRHSHSMLPGARMVAAGFALTVVGLAGVTGAGAAPAAPRCATSALVVWLDTQGDATAGSTFFNLRFTNLSRRRCTLVGYPGVSAVDLAGRQLGTPAGRNARIRVRTVSLAPGGSASALVQIADTGVFPRTSCRPVTAAGLRVYPPNQTRARLVPFPFGACSRAGPIYLHVTAAKPGR
jgi:hypothetical protein